MAGFGGVGEEPSQSGYQCPGWAEEGDESSTEEDPHGYCKDPVYTVFTLHSEYRPCHMLVKYDWCFF